MPAGERDPDLPQSQVLPLEHGPDTASYRIEVGFRQSQARGGRGQAIEVPGEGERVVVDHFDRLEDTVADRESVVGHPHRRTVRVVENPAVYPCAHTSETRPSRAALQAPNTHAQAGIGVSEHIG